MSNLTKADATKLARELATRLGKGWVADVQQNIEWFYGAKLTGQGAEMEVLSNLRGDSVEYTAYLRVGPLETVLSGADPVKVVSSAKKEMSEKVFAVQRAFNQLIHQTM